MVILYPFCPADEDLAHKNAEWIESLKNDTPLRVVLVRDSRCTYPNPFGEIAIKEINVKDRKNSWPESPNNMFAEGARYMEYFMPEEKSWLWLEPDAIPLCDGWLDKIIKERNQGYKKQKPFLGAYVPGAPGQEHLSGIAVYPNPLVLYAGLMLLENDAVPFDLADGPNVVRKAHLTDLIQNRPRKANRVGDRWVRDVEDTRFTSLDDFYKIATKECVLFHSDKHGDLIDLLRGRQAHGKNGTLTVQPSTQNNLSGESGSSPDAGKHPFTSDPKARESQASTAQTLQDHVAWLREYAAKDGFARMRCYKELISAGLREKKKK